MNSMRAGAEKQQELLDLSFDVLQQDTSGTAAVPMDCF